MGFHAKNYSRHELLTSLNNSKHEIGLHVANDPSGELKPLEEVTRRKTNFYTIRSIEKTRNMVREAEKSGIKTIIAETNEKLAEDIWKIYNETPIRQERAFPHYRVQLQTVTKDVLSSRNST